MTIDPFGPPEVLTLETLPEPTPSDDQRLIEVHLGAHPVVDYTRDDPRQLGVVFDAIIDPVGKSTRRSMPTGWSTGDIAAARSSSRSARITPTTNRRRAGFDRPHSHREPVFGTTPTAAARFS